DVCLDKLPVTFAIDRAGLVGGDGETHQGIFDLSFLSNIPNLTIIAPKNKQEFVSMLKFSFSYAGPIAIRYPRGNVYNGLESFHAPMIYGRSELIKRGKEIALLAVGSMNETAEKVVEQLVEKGYNPSFVNVRFIKPMDKEILKELKKEHTVFITMEENVQIGGFGQMVSNYFSEERDIRTLNISIPDRFVEHGNTDILKKTVGLDVDSIIERIMMML
ncbi:MAG: transketolase C-terminal domain-containing protein, partial [Acetivibrio sp.]